MFVVVSHLNIVKINNNSPFVYAFMLLPSKDTPVFIGWCLFKMLRLIGISGGGGHSL